MARLPHLCCCDDGARFVALRYPYEEGLLDRGFADRDAFFSVVRSTPPRWSLLARDDAGTARVATICCCPFCGVPVPGLRLRARPPRRVCATLDGGYYCDTCARRLIECRCAPPERLWEASSVRRRRPSRGDARRARRGGTPQAGRAALFRLRDRVDSARTARRDRVRVDVDVLAGPIAAVETPVTWAVLEATGPAWSIPPTAAPVASPTLTSRSTATATAKKKTRT